MRFELGLDVVVNKRTYLVREHVPCIIFFVIYCFRVMVAPVRKQQPITTAAAHGNKCCESARMFDVLCRYKKYCERFSITDIL